MKTYGITAKDKMGYCLGEVGAIILYMGVSNFLTLYFTDVLLLPMSLISIIFLVSRLWDAINDPILGRIADNMKPTAKGKYHRWVWFVPLLCISYALLFIKFPGLSVMQYFVYGLIIYNIYGMLSTCCSVPFGALANMITSDKNERTTLATFRGIGEVAGASILVMVVPMLIYSVGANGKQFVDARKIGTVMAVAAAIACVTYIMVFILCKERVPSKEHKEKVPFFTILKALLKDRAFVVFALANILFMAAPMYLQNSCQYIFIYYFGKGQLYSTLAIFTTISRLVVLVIMGKLAKKLGKKALTSTGLFLTSGMLFVAFFIHTDNIAVFIALMFISGIGESFLMYLVWAMITDVIENYVRKSGHQEVSTVYAAIMFARKIGTTIGGVGVPAVLGAIGYVAGNVSETVANRLYSAGTGGSAVMYLVIALLIAIAYPLGKKQVDALYASHTEG